MKFQGQYVIHIYRRVVISFPCRCLLVLDIKVRRRRHHRPPPGDVPDIVPSSEPLSKEGLGTTIIMLCL